MADIHTPFGSIPKPMFYIALIGGGGGLIYAWVRSKNKAAQTAAQTTSGSYGYGTATGSAYGYGSGQYGYGSYTYEPYGYGYGPMGLGAYGGSGYYGYGYYGAGVPEGVPQQATTNAQWTQAAVTALTAQGWTGQAVLTALGKYTTGQPVSSEEEGIITAAIGAEGYPPVSGPDGYPPAMRPAGSGGGGGGGSTQVTVPNVTGETQMDAFQTLKAAGLKGTGTPFIKGKTLRVKSQVPKAGSKVNKGTTVRLTSSVIK